MTTAKTKGAAGPDGRTIRYITTLSEAEARDYRRAAIADWSTQEGWTHIYDDYKHPAITLSDGMSIGQIMRQCRRMRGTDYMMCTAAQLADEFGISDDMAAQIYAYLHDEDDDEEASE